MKIIQSHADFEDLTPYGYGKSSKKKINKKLLFYSFLLSYITIKENCGNVTMFCDDNAYEKLIKYIPYDDIVFKRNDNSFRFWSKYKIDVMRLVNDDLIHFDSDVMIFDNDFKTVINSDWDVLVQDTIPPNLNVSKDFVKDNYDFLKNRMNLSVDNYDYRCSSCGTFGVKKDFLKNYLGVVDRIYPKLYDRSLIVNDGVLGMVLEELTAYLTTFYSSKQFKYEEVLPFDLVLKHGNFHVGNIKKYTHLWMRTKYEMKNIKLIRKKIIEQYPNYFKYVEEYEQKNNLLIS
jgi:hypothetical protein